ncbi:hypothetical protein SIO70_24255 [Chitinophaga sancti]|uniref:hypothetical protein n=1 Tax=Chitinophaga sancti TaxID=1004 RepID=UPI002A75C060|nr:hypothetical protein [Chitinophaga sancti]WPQ61475.1 hypothetical protein SIO70_24255 [Chitinophaga sancti]
MRWLSQVALILLSLSSVAQVSMTVQLPPTGVLQKALLWNMLLVSTSSSPILVKIVLKGLTNDQHYLFRLQNSRKEYWNAKFIYNNK